MLNLLIMLIVKRHKEKRIEAISINNDIPPLLENKDTLDFHDSNIVQEQTIQATPHIHASQDHGFN
jgi:hypothetical protein